MPFAAATATTGNGVTAALVLLTIIITLGYLAMCVFWPFRACRRCQGMGRIHGPFRGIRLCRHCQGDGLKLRAGRRVWNGLTRLYRDINRHR